MFQWISGLIQQSGYLGIAVLMLMENLFPPIPSELIMPLAGSVAARGELNIALVIMSGSVGSVIGASFWYYIGLRLGTARIRSFTARHGRWLTLSPKNFDQACGWFQRHCGKAVFIGRLVPTVRTLISLPAGIAAMSLPRFLAYTAAGTVLWTGLLAGAGYLLGREYQAVSKTMDPLSYVVLGVLVVWYLYRVVSFSPEGPSR